MTLKQQAWFIMQLYEEGYVTAEQASRWAAKMMGLPDYENLDRETQEALGSLEILDMHM